MKVAFLIRSMEIGGAERQLAYLATGLKSKGVSVSVGIFYRGGELEELLKKNGVTIEYLEKKRRWDIFGFIVRTLKWVRREKPDVLHGYLTGANLVAIFMKPFVSKLHIVWGVRASNMMLENYDRLARFTFSLSAHLSNYTDLIIVNSYSGFEYHLENGYPSDQMLVIPNGIDTDVFVPDLSARQRQRLLWGLGDEDYLVGLVGRLDPMKDHKTFLLAASMLLARKKDVQFVCVGNGDDRYLEGLKQYSDSLGISNNIRWESGHENIEDVYNALDVLVSTSAFGEGFSNTLAEGMSCGIPCVATDVGDARKILLDASMIVPVKNSKAVADAVLEVLEYKESTVENIKEQTREHILKNYSIERLVEKTLVNLTTRFSN